MKGPFPAYPFIIAAFPALFLYARNVESVPIRQVLVPILAAEFLVSLSWAILTLAFPRGTRSAALSTAWILLLQSYLPVAEFAPKPLLLWGLVFLLVTLILLRINASSPLFVRALNLLSILLLLPSLATLLLFGVRSSRQGSQKPDEIRPVPVSESRASQEPLPNIYHLVLDGYARQDVLQTLYGLDNRFFLDELRSLGFRVFPESCANYWQTLLSLSSTLNLSYLTYVDGQPNFIRTETGREGRLDALVKESVVREVLDSYGYRTVSFPTGYDGTEIPDADAYLEGNRRGFSRLSEYQYGLLCMTPVPDLLMALGVDAADRVETHRNTVLNAFRQMGSLSDREAPLWVFAHILAPHPPFVFLEDGRRPDSGRPFTLADGSDFFKLGGTSQDYRRSYRDQLMFINRTIRPVLPGILENATRPTVIILQADHGPGSQLDWDHREETRFDERMPILLALRLPGEDGRDLPADLSPVNLYRFLFTRYFGLDRPLLPNRSFYSTGPHPHRLVEVDPGARTPQPSPR
jgi:hypothetical protein